MRDEISIPNLKKRRVTIVVAGNSAWHLLQYRISLMKFLDRSGFKIWGVATKDGYEKEIFDNGFEFSNVPFGGGILRPSRDIFAFLCLFWFLVKARPAMYLGFTIKPNIFGGVICRFLRIPYVLNVTGLGSVFINEGFLSKVIILMSKIAFRNAKCVFFQNKDDLELFRSIGIVKAWQVDLLPGSGVDVERYRPVRKVFGGQPFRFLFCGRLLVDKGICEFVSAATIIRDQGFDAQFDVVGSCEVENFSSVSNMDLESWKKQNVCRFLGSVGDVRPYFSFADCVVLPSYREGTPRVLLEAASMSIPMIASDVPGCREVIDDQVNGLLCKVRDAEDLANKMKLMMSFSKQRLAELGAQGRKKMVNDYREDIVFHKYRDVCWGLEDPTP